MNNIKAFRKARGLTLKELGRLCDISESSMQRIESGTRKPSFEVLLKLGEAFDRPVSDIIGELPIENKTESELERKYMALDEHGRNLVDFILDSEYKRCAKAARSRGADYD